MLLLVYNKLASLGFPEMNNDKVEEDTVYQLQGRKKVKYTEESDYEEGDMNEIEDMLLVGSFRIL